MITAIRISIRYLVSSSNCECSNDFAVCSAAEDTASECKRLHYFLGHGCTESAAPNFLSQVPLFSYARQDLFALQVDTKPASDVIAGAVARAASQGTIHPLDTLKVQLQSGSGRASKPNLSKISQLVPPQGLAPRVAKQGDSLRQRKGHKACVTSKYHLVGLTCSFEGLY